MATELANDDVINTLFRDKYSELDLLGFAVAWFKFDMFSHCLPVISSNRLAKALVFTKTYKSLAKIEDVG